MKSHQILVVEDEAILAGDLSDQIQELGYDVAGISDNAEEAFETARQKRPDLVFMDISLKGAKEGKDGIFAATQIRKHLGIPIVFLTALSDHETLGRAKLAEPFGYLHKPCQPRDIRTAIEIALHKHQREQEVVRNEKQFRQTIDSIGEGVVAVDDQGKIALFNPAAETLTGWKKEDAIGQPVELVLPFVEKRDTETNTPELAPRDTTLITRDGREIPISERVTEVVSQGENKQQVVTFWNLNNSENSFQSLLRAQKLQSLGNLASGMAHEFNNQLTPILGYTTLLKSMMVLDDFTTEIFESIEESINRISNITRQMLSYAGKNRSELIPIDINYLIKNSHELINISATKKVHFVTNLGEDLPQFDANPQDIQQILLNLLSNSVESFENKGGQITLSTNAGHYTAEQLRSPFLEVQPLGGHFVHLQVKDNGPGIPAKFVSQIFDPFFTTKFPGRGLGLAVVLGIIGHHNGSIQVDSNPNTGTQFDLYFPVAKVS